MAELRFAKLGMVAAGLTVLAACSSPGGGVTSPSATSVAAGSTASASATAKSVLTHAQSVLATDFKGTFTTPADSGPPPKKHAKVMVISCGQITDACSVPAAAALQAGSLLGWNMTLFDGKLDPTQWNGAVKQAITTKQNAIILDSIDCGPVKQSLTQARSAGIKVYAFYSFDCSDPVYGGGPSLFDGTTVFSGSLGSDYAAFARAFGAAEADYAIVKTGGQARAVEFTLEDIAFSKYAKDGFDAELATCAGCKVLSEVKYTGTQIGPPLTGIAQSAFLRNPTANVSFAPVDSGAAFIAPAVHQLDSRQPMVAIGGEGLQANIDMIRAGKGEDLATGGVAQWVGWAAIDGVNRLLNGQQPADSGIGIMLVDRQHNLPASGPVPAPVDFEAAYKKAWGLS